jgi:transcriptional regulator GlxA family with amidase domain
MGAMATDEPRQIGIVLFDGVEELDAIGPWDVLAHWTRRYPGDGFAVSCVSREGGAVECAKGLTVQAHHAYSDAPGFEVLLHPGGRGTRVLVGDEAHLAWVRRQRDTTTLMTSVCTGSLVYAAAGLLAGRPATTHWGAIDELADLDPTVTIRAEERFVDDGDMITSAGVS